MAPTRRAPSATKAADGLATSSRKIIAIKDAIVHIESVNKAWKCAQDIHARLSFASAEETTVVNNVGARTLEQMCSWVFCMSKEALEQAIKSLKSTTGKCAIDKMLTVITPGCDLDDEIIRDVNTFLEELETKAFRKAWRQFELSRPIAKEIKKHSFAIFD